MKKTKIDQSGLTERQIKALPHFIGSTSEAEACRQAKLAKQTYYDWLKEPAFRKSLKDLRDRALENAVETLKTHATRAVGVLVGLLDRDNPSLQRNVANDILGHVAKFKELNELEMRLEALEGKLK
ncbi:MAG: hypothetical protein JSS62_07150 [Verrucomicrobia bacterium]|nr:hypothetical protein [Verrucomicrobiota bacterium]MBS0645878.1 hypothetical protein [Verrucomicrobiota bacterium]